MCKEDVDKILMINLYLTICKKSKVDCHKIDLVKKFLGRKLKKFLVIS
jgi:hypothetical protein